MPSRPVDINWVPVPHPHPICCTPYVLYPPTPPGYPPDTPGICAYLATKLATIYTEKPDTAVT